MGKKKGLSSEEIGKIKAFKQESYSIRQIAKKIGRSADVVSRFLRDPENYGKNYKGGVKTATTERERRKILREASNSTLSASQIAAIAGTSASVWTVRRIIHESPNLQRKRLNRKPSLTRTHKEKRLEFARRHMAWTEEWKRVIFSDEKKFNLDGPDGYSYYFHDIRREALILSRRHSREGSVMIWGATAYNSPGMLEILDRRQTAETYISTLRRAAASVDEVVGNMDWIFQHDYAAVHTAHIVRNWFLQENIDVLEWPSRSPDLNIIENLWGWLSRRVYRNSKQFENVQELKQAILTAWSEIPPELIHNLYSSLPNRIFQVINRNGRATKY